MKILNLLSFLFILFLTTTVDAQTTVLKLEVDAAPTKKTKRTSKNDYSKSSKTYLDLNIVSAEYQEAEEANNSGSRRQDASSGSNKYTITRMTDSQSSTLQNAASNGQIYKSAIISLVNGSSQTKIDLVNVFLSAYSPSFINGQASETFDVNFQTQNISSN